MYDAESQKIVTSQVYQRLISETYSQKVSEQRSKPSFSFAKTPNATKSSSLSKHKSKAAALLKRADMSADLKSLYEKTDEIINSSNYTSNASQDQVKASIMVPTPTTLDQSSRGVFT